MRDALTLPGLHGLPQFSISHRCPSRISHIPEQRDDLDHVLKRMRLGSTSDHTDRFALELATELFRDELVRVERVADGVVVEAVFKD